MMRMGKREGQDLYDSDLRFGKRGKNLLIHILKKVHMRRQNGFHGCKGTRGI